MATYDLQGLMMVTTEMKIKVGDMHAEYAFLVGVHRIPGTLTTVFESSLRFADKKTLVELAAS